MRVEPTRAFPFEVDFGGRRGWYAPGEVVGLVEEGGPPIRYLDISVPLAPAIRAQVPPEDPIPSDLDPIIRDL